jgi:hypothetical protein
MKYDEAICNELFYLFQKELNEWILNTIKGLNGKIILGNIPTKKEYFLLHKGKKISTFNYKKFCIERLHING